MRSVMVSVVSSQLPLEVTLLFAGKFLCGIVQNCQLWVVCEKLDCWFTPRLVKFQEVNGKFVLI